MAMPAAASDRLRVLIERLVHAVGQAARQAGPDQIHDVRVAIRRLDGALESFKDWLPRRRVRKLRDRLKATLKLAGRVRDIDIAVKLIDDLESEVNAPARADLEAERDAAAADFVGALRRILSRNIAAKWSDRLQLAVAGDSDPAPFCALAKSLLPELADSFITSGASLAGHPESGRRLHAFRISAKRFRYALESFAPCYTAALEERISTVRKIQNALGDIQDCVATRKLLKKRDHPGSLLRRLKHEESIRVAGFRDLWPGLFGAVTKREWSRYLSRTGRITSTGGQ